MSAPDFAVEIFQNKYLPVGAREVNAIVTVTSGEMALDTRSSKTVRLGK